MPSKSIRTGPVKRGVLAGAESPGARAVSRAALGVARAVDESGRGGKSRPGSRGAPPARAASSSLSGNSGDGSDFDSTMRYRPRVVARSYADMSSTDELSP